MELAGEDKTSCSITEPSLPHFPILTLGTSQAWVNRVQITKDPPHSGKSISTPAAALEIIVFILFWGRTGRGELKKCCKVSFILISSSSFKSLL